MRNLARERRSADLPHHLKHSVASHLATGNVNLAVVQQCVGHKGDRQHDEVGAVTDTQAMEAAHAGLMRFSYASAHCPL